MNTNEHHTPHPQVAEKAAEVAKHVRQIQSGNRSAFHALYDATEQYIYFCISSQGVPDGDVADVMQEVYLAVYKDLHTIKEPQAAMGWMKSIAFHKSMDYFRRMGKDVLTATGTEEFLNVQEDETLRLPEDVMEKEESGHLIRNLIRELPDEYRRVLILHYFLECSVAEIAKETGVPEGTVKTRLYRARKELGMSIEALEKQQGIRLHSVLLVPALGLLFHQEAQAAQIPAQVHGTVEGALAHAVGTTAGNGAATATGLVAKKWIIAAVATLCVGGGGALLLWQGVVGTNPSNVPRSETASNDTAEQNTVSESTTESTVSQPSSIPPEPTVEPVDKMELFAAYKKLYEIVQADRTWPDGVPLAINGDLGEALQYALQDLDGDGNEELVISTVTADYMAAYTEKMYKYDPASKECIQVASMYPSPIYYDNGIIYGTSSNDTRFSNSMQAFNKESGVYEEIASTTLIFRGDLEVIGLPFPEEVDKDGDDSIWKIQVGNEETYMDTKEGEAWIQEKIGMGKQIEVKWIPFSEGWKY